MEKDDEIERMALRICDFHIVNHFLLLMVRPLCLAPPSSSPPPSCPLHLSASFPPPQTPSGPRPLPHPPPHPPSPTCTSSTSQAVKLYMRTECKCHGLSGSCTLRTCWKKMPHFREVGDRLLERFNGASKVMGGNDGKTLIPVGHNIKPPDKQDLIYSDESPDFCVANRKTGSLGTRGRICNSTAMDISGCDLLCCERGYREETVVFEENCLCRFHWCCVVQCKKCVVRKELSICQ